MAVRRPSYVSQALGNFLDYCEETNNLLHLAMRAIEHLGKSSSIAPRALRLIGAVKEEGEIELLEQKYKLTVELAEKETNTGFPLLHAHAAVGLWGAFEAAVEDMLVGILVNEPSVLQGDQFKKIRVPLAEFELLDKEDRMRLLLSEIGRSQGARRRGIDQFEGLLAYFDLSGSVDAEDRKTVWELNHVRNVIVHRASLADRHLIAACPWLGLTNGQRVVVSHSSLGKYRDVLCQYVIVICERLDHRYGVDNDARVRQSSSEEPTSELSPDGDNRHLT